MSRIVETMNRAELLRIARELEAENEELRKALLPATANEEVREQNERLDKMASDEMKRGAEVFKAPRAGKRGE